MMQTYYFALLFIGVCLIGQSMTQQQRTPEDEEGGGGGEEENKHIFHSSTSPFPNPSQVPIVTITESSSSSSSISPPLPLSSSASPMVFSSAVREQEVHQMNPRLSDFNGFPPKGLPYRPSQYSVGFIEGGNAQTRKDPPSTASYYPMPRPHPMQPIERDVFIGTNKVVSQMPPGRVIGEDGNIDKNQIKMEIKDLQEKLETLQRNIDQALKMNTSIRKKRSAKKNSDSTTDNKFVTKMHKELDKVLETVEILKKLLGHKKIDNKKEDNGTSKEESENESGHKEMKEGSGKNDTTEKVDLPKKERVIYKNDDEPYDDDEDLYYKNFN